MISIFCRFFGAVATPLSGSVLIKATMIEIWNQRRALQFANRYQRAVSRSWFGPIKMTSSMLLFAVIVIAIAATVNSLVRAHQLKIWNANQELTYIEGAPSFSTADAPFFLHYARLHSNGSSIAELDGIRLYPNQAKQTDDVGLNDSIFDWPLISIALSTFSSDSEIRTLLVSANIMIIVTAAATALMISICFGAAGYWTEGGVAAIGGGLCSAYLVRSSIGRIDTDQLNLGLFYLLFGLIVFAGRAGSRVRALCWCAAAGLSANLFMWWYSKQELIVIVALALSWVLVCLHRNAVTAISGTLIFLASSSITFFNPFGSAYFKDVLTTASFIFPNTLETVTEVQRASLGQILSGTSGTIEMGIFCIAGLGLFLVRHPVIAIAYGPLVAFGLLNFLIGNRAIFYSAPIMWFGAAFMITTAARFILANLSKDSCLRDKNQLATILAASFAMIIAWVNSATSYLPRPSFSKPILEAFASLKTDADPSNAVVATWWDYGYSSMLFNDLATLHDGGAHTTPSTYFVARAFLDPDQYYTVGNLKFLATRGHAGIAAESNVADLDHEFSKAINAPSPNLYIVVTSQMAGWMGSISQIGNWDIETGKPVDLRGNSKGPLVNYERMNCRLGGYPQTLACAGAAFDLERGLVNGAPVLAGWAHSQDGATVRRKSFSNDGDLAMQIVQTGNRINVFLMHRQLFDSSFNELFYLGQIDHPSISLHYDDYPHIRIYKIDGKPAG